MIYFIATGRWWLFPLGLILGYGCAWLGHFLIEKNRPATFRYPLWSFMGDYKMIGMMVTGRISEELRQGISFSSYHCEKGLGASVLGLGFLASR
jgi:hypothetical protein